MKLESDNVPLKTEPKPPPPSFSEKFFVALCKSLYPKATSEPSTAFGIFIVRLFHFKIANITRPRTKPAEPATAPIIIPLLFLELENSDAASLIIFLKLLQIQEFSDPNFTPITIISISSARTILEAC
ncbi:hypothetical protein QQP08_006594 [Theobroma cacao]|nr:hypothetical protein QQP08_006594 [Theobroma cacao]